MEKKETIKTKSTQRKTITKKWFDLEIKGKKSFWARHFTVRVPLSTQLYNRLLGVTSMGEQKYSQSCDATKTEISSGGMAPLHGLTQTLPALSYLPPLSTSLLFCIQIFLLILIVHLMFALQRLQELLKWLLTSTQTW